MLNKVVSVGMGSRIGFLPALLIFMALSFNPACAHAAEDVYGMLKIKLMQDGFSRQQVAGAFRHAPPPMFKLVSQTMKIREGQVNYDHFLAPSEIAAARRVHSRSPELFPQGASGIRGRAGNHSGDSSR